MVCLASLVDCPSPEEPVRGSPSTSKPASKSYLTVTALINNYSGSSGSPYGPGSFFSAEGDLINTTDMAITNDYATVPG